MRDVTRNPNAGAHCPECDIPLSDGYVIGCAHCQDRRSSRLRKGQLFSLTGYSGEVIDNRDPRGRLRAA